MVRSENCWGAGILNIHYYGGFERLVLFHHGWCTRLQWSNCERVRWGGWAGFFINLVYIFTKIVGLGGWGGGVQPPQPPVNSNPARLSDTHASHLSRKWYRPRSADHRLEYLVGSHGRTRLMDCAHAIRDSLHRRRPSLFRNRYVVELNGNPVRGSQQLPSIFIIAAIINIIIIIISINF